MFVKINPTFSIPVLLYNKNVYSLKLKMKFADSVSFLLNSA